MKEKMIKKGDKKHAAASPYIQVGSYALAYLLDFVPVRFLAWVAESWRDLKSVEEVGDWKGGNEQGKKRETFQLSSG